VDNQHGPKSEYYTSSLSFNEGAIPEGSLLNAAQALKESLRDVKDLINVYVKDGTVKKMQKGNSWELFSADKNALDKILPDFKAALDEIEQYRKLEGTFSLSGSSPKKYDVFSGEFFGDARKLKELSATVDLLGGRVSSDGRVQKIELPQGAVNPVTGAEAIRSVRSTFGNAKAGIKSFLASKGIGWDEYKNATDTVREALMDQAFQIERDEIASRPDVAERRYAGKEKVARANADATGRRIDEIIANNEEPLLPATTSAKLRPKDKARWAAYKKHWEMRAVTPGMLETAASDRLSQRVALNKAEVAWAKKHKEDPLAKAILRNDRNRRGKPHGPLKGSRTLSRALHSIRATAVGTLLGTIAAAVGAMVKFLSSLPSIAGNIHKMATTGERFNIPTHKLDQYGTMAKAMGKDATAFETSLSVVYDKLGSIMDGDIGGALKNTAALSGLVGNGATNAMVDYFTQKSKDPSGTMHAMFNDLMKASFLGMTMLSPKAGSVDYSTAFSRNLRQMGLQGTIVEELAREWDGIKNDEQKKQIRDAVIGGGDFIELMGAHFRQHGVMSTRELTGDSQHKAAEENANAFQKVAAAASAVKDSVLEKILSYMGPISDWLHDILLGVLRLLNSTFLRGQYDEQIAAMEDQNAALNASNREMNLSQITVLRAAHDAAIEKYGLQDKADRQRVIEGYAKGVSVMPNMTWEETASFAALNTWLADALKKEELFSSPKYLSGEKRLAAISPAQYASKVFAFQAKAAHNRAELFEDLIARYGQDLEKQNNNPKALDPLINLTLGAIGALGTPEGLKARGYSTWGEPWAVSAASKPSVTGKSYRNAKEELQDLQLWADALRDLQGVLAEVNKEGGYFDAKEYGRDLATRARETGDRALASSMAIDQIRAELGDKYLGELIKKGASGEAEVRLVIDSGKQEFVIYQKDLATGRDLRPPLESSTQPFSKSFSFKLFGGTQSFLFSQESWGPKQDSER
jgi:hypothetical protein